MYFKHVLYGCSTTLELPYARMLNNFGAALRMDAQLALVFHNNLIGRDSSYFLDATLFGLKLSLEAQYIFDS